KCRPNGFEVRVLLDGVRRAIAAESRLLEPAEGRGDRRAIETVDPNCPGTQRLGHTVGRVDVAGPNGCCKTVDDVVRHDECLGLPPERGDREYRTENLLA